VLGGSARYSVDVVSGIVLRGSFLERIIGLEPFLRKKSSLSTYEKIKFTVYKIR